VFSKTLALLLTLSTGAVPVPAQDVPLRGVDLFCTTQISIDQINQRFRRALEKLAHALAAHDDRAFIDLYSKVTLGIQAMGDFAYAEISPVIYFDKGEYCYVTVDIVEQRDKDRRLKFRPQPRKRFSDPDGLLATWGEYEGAALALIEKGELNRGQCPDLYSEWGLWGFDHPALKKYDEIFRAAVPKNKQRLKAILREDEKETNRARAVFLLTQLPDPHEVVRALVPSMRDSSPRVRTRVLRALYQLVKKRPDVVVPVGPFLEALDLPATIERSKALAILGELANKEENKGILIRKGGSGLTHILMLLQPNNHDYAYDILKKISGKDFGERNYKAWEQWLNSERGHSKSIHL